MNSKNSTFASLQWEHSEIERLRLHALRWPPTFIVGDAGKLVQKKSGAARPEAARFHTELEQARRQFGTKFAPRAAVGLRIHVAVDVGTPPTLEALAKFYIDLTKGTLIRDDRQIEYLEITVGSPRGQGRAAGKIYLEIERLERLRRRFDFASSHSEVVGNEPEFEEDFNPDLAELLFDRGSRRVAHWLTLEKSRLYWHERPLSLSARNDFERDLARYRQPLVVELPPLPTLGDGRSLRSEASEAYRLFARQFPRLVRLQVPIDLDVQIWTPSRLERDLDNVLGSLLPPFREVLLGEQGKIFSIRIYVNRTTRISPPPMVRIKILPMGTIRNWDARVDAILEAMAVERS